MKVTRPGRSLPQASSPGKRVPEKSNKMRHDSRYMRSMNDGEHEATRPHALDESSFPASSMSEGRVQLSELVEQCQREINASGRGDAPTDVSGVKLLRRATLDGDQEARASFQQCLGEVVSGWLRRHPRWDAAARLDSEENYVTQAFTRFWQATTQQRLEFDTLAAALGYLRASLNGALLETLRTASRPGEVSLPEPDEAGEPHVEDRAASLQVWELLQSILPNTWEQRLASLLYPRVAPRVSECAKIALSRDGKASLWLVFQRSVR
jgi:hypothetical protein